MRKKDGRNKGKISNKQKGKKSKAYGRTDRQVGLH
jgi:hypothetical protein